MLSSRKLSYEKTKSQLEQFRTTRVAREALAVQEFDAFADLDLDIKMAAVSEISSDIQRNLDKLGFTMTEMIALSVLQADDYET